MPSTMYYSHQSQTGQRWQRPPAKRVDYLETRLRRMVQSVLRQESKAGSSCPIADTIINKERHFLIKGVWLALVGMIFAVFTYQTYDRISYYFTYPVAADVFITSTAYQHLPEVTICYQDPAGLYEMNDTHDVSCKYKNALMLMSGTLGLSTDDVWKNINSSKAIISAQEIIGTDTIPLNYTEEPLTWGTCTTFRSSDSNKPIQTRDHYFKITFKSFLTGCDKLSTAVYVHDRGDHPNLRQMLVCITPATCELAMTKRKFLFVNRRGNSCTTSGNLRACVENCMEKFIYQMGGNNCRFPFYPPKIKNISLPCVTSDTTYGYLNILHNYMNGASDTVCQCTRKCEHTTFSERPITYSSKPNTSTFVIRYDVPYETIIKERLCYGSIELFCDIGGNSGLFVGVSLLSVLQLGHIATRLKKTRRQYSMKDPLYKKVLKTYALWRKQVQDQVRLPAMLSCGKLVVVFKLGVIAVCVCMLVVTSLNRISFFFEYPMKTTVDITFNMSLEAPSLIVCPGDPNVFTLQQKVAETRNSSNPCDVNVWDLFELPGMNCTEMWPRNDNTSREGLKGNPYIQHYPHIPVYEGTCIDLNDGSITIPPNKLFMFAGFYPSQCGTYHQKAYLRSSTGNIDYYRYELVAHNRIQLINFVFKEIHIAETGVPCISNEENEQCLTDCLNRMLFNRMSCRLPYMTETDLPLCRSSSSVRQAHLAFRDLFLTPGNTKDCSCLPKCRTRFMEFRHYVQDEEVPMTLITFGPSNNVVESYVIQRAYSMVKLLCDLGGLLGSTLGFSIFGIIEIAMLFVVNRLERSRKPQNAARQFRAQAPYRENMQRIPLHN